MALDKCAVWFGFQRTTKKSGKKFFGFQTGDIGRAVVTKDRRHSLRVNWRSVTDAYQPLEHNTLASITASTNSQQPVNTIRQPNPNYRRLSISSDGNGY